MKEIGLADIFRSLWIRRLRVLVGALPLAVIGVAYALLASPEYTATTLLMPVTKPLATSRLGQLSGLASIAGIDLEAGDSVQLPIAALRSRDFARDFIIKHQLLSTLKGKSPEWPGRLLSIRQEADSFDIRDAVKRFDESVRLVAEDKKTGLVNLTVTWSDPVVAAGWANSMVSDLNDRLRDQAEREAQRNIDYLNGQVRASNVPALQLSLARILEGEMQKLMLAKGNTEYAFKVLDTATVPKRRSFPKRTQIVVASFLLGLLLSSAVVLGKWGVSGNG